MQRAHKIIIYLSSFEGFEATDSWFFASFLCFMNVQNFLTCFYRVVCGLWLLIRVADGLSVFFCS